MRRGARPAVRHRRPAPARRPAARAVPAAVLLRAARPATSTTASSTTSTPSPSPTSPWPGCARRAKRWSGCCRRIATATAGSRRTRCSSSSPTTCRSSSTPCAWCSSARRSACTSSSTRCSPSAATTSTGSSTSPRTGRRAGGVCSRPGRRSRSTAPTTPRRAELEDDVLGAVDDVRRAVDDFPAMRDADGGARRRRPAPAVAGRRPVRVPRCRRLRRRRRRRPDAARRAASSGWPATTTAFASPRPMPGAGAVVIARTDDTSRGLPGRAPDRRRRHRPPATPSSAGSSGCWPRTPTGSASLDIPGVGAGRGRRPRPDDAHACTRTPGGPCARCSRTCPASSSSSSSRRPLARLVADIVGLQERQLVRVFEVPEPVGPWITVLVYLPRNRFTAELPERIADAVADGVRRRPAHVRAAPRVPARWPASRSACGARTAGGRSTSRRSSGRSTSSRRRGPTGCGRCSWPTSARSRPRRCSTASASHAPAAYRAAVPPERANGDVRRIAALLAGDDEMTTSLGHDVDAPPGEWRFRVYRRGQPAALSELLPLLDHLGLQALDERAVHVPRRRRAGLRLRHRRPGAGRRRARRRPPRRGCRTRSPPWSAARSRATASTGSSCGPGSSAREVDDRARPTASTCARSASPFSQPYIEDTLARHPRLVADLVALFHARFDPARFGGSPDGPRTRRRPACARASSRRSTPSPASTTTASAARS